MDFVARGEELGDLEDAWRRTVAGAPQLVVCYGRRRVGKTTLLWHFSRGKPSVFHFATEQSTPVELQRFADAIRDEASLGQRSLDRSGGFARWEEALRFLGRVAEDQPLLVVIDEMPYLLAGEPGFASAVQAVWDELRLLGRSRLMLVLTGSARRVIQSVFGGSGPLYGRETVRLPVEPFALGQARAMLPGLAGTELVEAYAACGGYPQHLLAWDPEQSTRSNLNRLAGTSGGLLLENGVQIVNEEVASTPGHVRVLAAVARGAHKFSSLQSEAGQRVDEPLRLLTQVGLLSNEVPVGAPQGARRLYRIDDPYLAFWFTVLYEGRARIEATGTRGLLDDQRWRGRWQRHVGSVFEELARAHARAMVKTGELEADEVGRWWSHRGQSVEIDVAGFLDGELRFVGEAKWSELAERDLARIAKSLAGGIDRIGSAARDPLRLIWAKRAPGEARRGLEVFTADDMAAALS